MLKPRHPQNPGNPPLRYVSPSRVDKKGEVAAVHDFGSRIRFSSQPSDMAVVGDCIHHIFACCNEINPADTYKVKNLVSAYGLTGVLSQHGQINEAWNNLTLYLSKAHGQALKIYHERPFRMESGGQTVVGSMDLVWQTAEGDILVDFKTCPMGTEAILDKNSDNYAGRHAGQLDAYEDALVSAGENVVARYIYYPVSGFIVSITHGKQLLPTQ